MAQQGGTRTPGVKPQAPVFGLLSKPSTRYVLIVFLLLHTWPGDVQAH